MMGQLLSEQDNQSHHTEHEATIQNHRHQQQHVSMNQSGHHSTNDAVRTPPMYVGTGAYLTSRQQQQAMTNSGQH